MEQVKNVQTYCYAEYVCASCGEGLTASSDCVWFNFRKWLIQLFR